MHPSQGWGRGPFQALLREHPCLWSGGEAPMGSCGVDDSSVSGPRTVARSSLSLSYPQCQPSWGREGEGARLALTVVLEPLPGEEQGAKHRGQRLLPLPSPCRGAHLAGDQLHGLAGPWPRGLSGALTQLGAAPADAAHAAPLQRFHPSAVGRAALPGPPGALLPQGERRGPRGEPPPPCLRSCLQWGGPR